MYGDNMPQRDDSRGYPAGQPVEVATTAPGLEAVHTLCKNIYPDQVNPLTVTAVVKYWLGGPDPLDYISMFDNPGCAELGVPPHWHYVSMGLSDLHGDGRLHPRTGPGRPSGFGFELTFRLVKESTDTTPPTWPANVMQQLAKYVFTSGNMLLPGDHVSWHTPLGNGSGRITQILMGRDPQLPVTTTPHGQLAFVQIIGVTPEELLAAQHWNGLGMVNLLKTIPSIGPWHVTNPHRRQSAMEEDPSVAEKVQSGIEREGSNLSGVSAKCWWVQMSDPGLSRAYRESRGAESGDEDDSAVGASQNNQNPQIKTERVSPQEQQVHHVQMQQLRLQDHQQRLRQLQNWQHIEQQELLQYPIQQQQQLQPQLQQKQQQELIQLQQSIRMQEIQHQQEQNQQANEQSSQSPQDPNAIKILTGLHISLNLEAGQLLTLAIKGRVMHGRHFTFKSILSNTAITIVAPSVTGTLVTQERPYVVQGPWLQVLLPPALTDRMAYELRVLNSNDYISLPRTFTWPEYRLAITIIGD